MGSSFAPCEANLFLARMGETIILNKNSNPFFQFVKKNKKNPIALWMTVFVFTMLPIL